MIDLGLSLWSTAVFNSGAAVGPSGPVVLTFQTSGNGSNSGTTQSFGTVTIGASPSANRRVIVAFGGGGYGGGNSIVSAVFTPNAGSPISNDNSVITAGIDSVTNNGLSLVSAVLPVGTTFTLAVTFSSAPFNSPTFAVYTVDNSTLSNPTTPVHSFVQGTTSPLTGTVNTLSGGGLVAQFLGSGSSSNAFTAGITSSDATFGQNTWGSLSNMTPSTPLSVTNTWATTGNVDLALWTYR